MTVSLLMPIGFDDPRRTQIYQWVMARWFEMFPSWQFCVGQDDDQENYNRSAARNGAFAQADGEYLVITDADTAINRDNMKAALWLCRETQQWVIAHSTYYSLTEDYTTKVLEGSVKAEMEAPLGTYDWKMVERSEAGVLVMPREAYEKVEGYDERFEGWGYEDNAFAEKLRQKWSQPLRSSGDVFHLWHPRGLDFDQPMIKYNEALLEEIRNGL